MKTATGYHGHVSRIPMGSSASTNNFERKVQIGYRPVGGRVAAWTVGVIHTLLKRSSQMPLKEELPDPHYHWCVLVGEYYHQIQITDDLLWYENCEVSWKDGWSVFEVGETRFNDAAIVEAAIETVNTMPDTYDLWTNNCHHFTLNLIDKICIASHKVLSKSYRRHQKSSSMQFVDDESTLATAKMHVAGPGRTGLESKTSFEKLEVALAKEDAEREHKQVLEKAQRIMGEHTPNVVPNALKRTA